MRSPAYQFYPADWLGSQRVQMLTLEEEGAYQRLLCFCWQHGSIPANPEQAARLIGKGASTTLANTVLTMFQPHPTDGTLMVHDRLDFERRKQENWRQKSSEGGKKSAANRLQSKPKSRVVQPPSQGCLENGANQKATLQSSVFPLQSSSSSPDSSLHTPKEEGDKSATLSPPSKKSESAGLQEVFDAWNALPGVFPQCLLLSDKRRRTLQIRLREPFFAGAWRDALARLSASRFAQGENDRGWRASFDWFITPDVVQKIMEGKYDTRNGKKAESNQTPELITVKTL